VVAEQVGEDVEQDHDPGWPGERWRANWPAGSPARARLA
jgi:hypothetical protein